MAISAPHYRCLKELHRRGELPQGGAILEIGEANWYGDISLDVVRQDYEAITGNAAPPDIAAHLDTRLGDANRAYDVVKIIYKLFLKPKEVVSIDLHGTDRASKQDLNKPIIISQPCETVINHGTLEHVFNVAQVLTTMHNWCRVNGLMIHESPFTGWVDHGFWNIQPTLFYDMAAANKYDIVFMAIEQIERDIVIEIQSREQLLQMAKGDCLPTNAMLYVALRKTVDEPFRIPMQGYYAQTISTEAHQAWRSLR